jgi:hypothetical protein
VYEIGGTGSILFLLIDFGLPLSRIHGRVNFLRHGTFGQVLRLWRNRLEWSYDRDCPKYTVE